MLMHLSLSACVSLTHMPHGIGELTRLEFLSDFIVDKEGRGAELSELKNLKKLRGYLCITNMGFVKNAKFELQALNLEHLELHWTSSAEDDIENDEMSMDVLQVQPQQNLKVLVFSHYRGAKFSSWLSALMELKALHLHDCTNIRSLPPFDQLPKLNDLILSGLTNLEHVEIGISCNNGGLPFFQSLTYLSLISCPNLKGWVICSGTEQPSSTSQFLSFNCLSELYVCDCPNLNSVPPFPSIENLKFQGKSMKQLEQLLKPNISTVATYSGRSKLKWLTIKGIEEETVLAGELQQMLASLISLQIVSCPGIVKMECPPFVLRGLHKLVLEDLHEMESFPKWQQPLSTLKHLTFENCGHLASVPEWMRELTSLEHLDIRRCLELSGRCKDMNAEDWPKIAHIPFINVECSISAML